MCQVPLYIHFLIRAVGLALKGFCLCTYGLQQLDLERLIELVILPGLRLLMNHIANNFRGIFTIETETSITPSVLQEKQSRGLFLGLQ